MARVRKRIWQTDTGTMQQAWVCDWSDSAGNRHRRQFSTKREAEEFRVEIEGQVRAGTFRKGADKCTVSDLCVEFLSHCRDRAARDERMTERNYRTYKGHIKNHILHVEVGVGAIKLSQLSASRVCDFRDRLRTAGTTIPTTRRILATMRSALEFAITRDLLAINPARGVRVLGPRDEGSQKVVPPAKGAMTALLNAADPDFRVKLLFAAATGVRAGELHGLRWKHIDFVKREVQIIVRVDAYGNEGPPKSAAGNRSIPLAEKVLTELRAWRLRSRFSGAEDLVFPNSCGRFESHNNMSKRQFKPLIEQTGIEPFPWHALRHFAVSSWIEAGLSPKIIQTFAGHSSLSVTMDRYGHLFPSEDHQAAMDRIAQDFFSS